jgi:hypothetical protein
MTSVFDFLPGEPTCLMKSKAHKWLCIALALAIKAARPRGPGEVPGVQVLAFFLGLFDCS